MPAPPESPAEAEAHPATAVLPGDPVSVASCPQLGGLLWVYVIGALTASRRRVSPGSSLAWTGLPSALLCPTPRRRVAFRS